MVLSRVKISHWPGTQWTRRFSLPTVRRQPVNMLGVENDQVVVGYISSIVEYEGIETLLDGYEKLSNSNDNVTLLIVGDGPHLNRLRTHAEKNDIPNVILLAVFHTKMYSPTTTQLNFRRSAQKTRVTELVTPT